MIYVMSDIHGNLQRFDSIMRQINLQPEDTLYILGDVVDRYDHGIKILRKLMAMPNVKMLLGNHEYMMINAIGEWLKDPSTEPPSWFQTRLWYKNGGYVTHNYLKRIKKEYRAEILRYLLELPINIDVEVAGIKYKLVHASPIENYDMSYCYRHNYANQNEFAIWERWDETQPVPEGYVMIFGHTPTVYFQNRRPFSIWKSDSAIGIDCGSGFSDGRLCALRLDDMQEFYSN